MSVSKGNKKHFEPSYVHRIALNWYITSKANYLQDYTTLCVDLNTTVAFMMPIEIRKPGETFL